MKTEYIKATRLKPRDYVGKDLRSPKYRMRVVDNKLRSKVKYPKQEIYDVLDGNG